MKISWPPPSPRPLYLLVSAPSKTKRPYLFHVHSLVLLLRLGWLMPAAYLFSSSILVVSKMRSRNNDLTLFVEQKSTPNVKQFVPKRWQYARLNERESRNFTNCRQPHNIHSGSIGLSDPTRHSFKPRKIKSCFN